MKLLIPFLLTVVFLSGCVSNNQNSNSNESDDQGDSLLFGEVGEPGLCYDRLCEVRRFIPTKYIQQIHFKPYGIFIMYPKDGKGLANVYIINQIKNETEGSLVAIIEDVDDDRRVKEVSFEFDGHNLKTTWPGGGELDYITIHDALERGY